MKSDSVTRWFHEMGGSPEESATRLWAEFSDRLVAVARSNMPRVSGSFDEEDVALSAFNGFCNAAKDGRYAQLNGREELWRLLSVITARKAHERTMAEVALKRGGGRTLHATNQQLDEHEGSSEDPQLSAIISEELRRLFGLLKDPELEQLALWKLDGLTDREAADRLNCSRRSVQRMLRVIRECWQSEVLPASTLPEQKSRTA